MTARTSRTPTATKPGLQRLDVRLVQAGLARSRAQARELIELGIVTVHDGNGQPLPAKATARYNDRIRMAVNSDHPEGFVSRGGDKLQHALANFDISPEQKLCLDAGQSTGGFTDCLLRAGAGTVVGIDVGHSQLSAKLQNHAQVISLEGMNLRYQSRTSIAKACEPADPQVAAAISSRGFGLVTADLSFISLSLILPALADALATNGQLIALVKPQFELGADALNKRGVVKNNALLDAMQSRMQQLAASLELQLIDWTNSPITGASGNREFLMHLQHRDHTQ